jgi:hypothetical protein
MSNLFSAIESAELKEAALAKLESAEVLALARIVARGHAERFGVVTADDVGKVMKDYHGIDSMGPAAGALFRGPEWEFTGQRVLSSRVSNHSREIKVWRLKR